MSVVTIPVQAMTARVYSRLSARAVWSRRLAFFAAQVAILAVLLHRFGWIGTPVGVNLLVLAVGTAITSLLLALAAAAQIWQQGIGGMGRAAAGAAIAMTVLAGPAIYLPDLLFRPQLNDIVTDADNVPQYSALALARLAAGAESVYPRERFSGPQYDAYPHIRPMVLERSAVQTFDLVKEAAERLNWKVVRFTPPTASEPGYIEAVAHTLVMAFADDVAIRVNPGTREAQIDVRSASRYGKHDFGANAKRITRLFDEIRFGLEKGEKEALELALARRAAAERERVRKARAEREKLKAEEEKRLTRLREELDRQQQGPAQSETPGEPEPRARQRLQGWDLDASTFWRRFGE